MQWFKLYGAEMLADPKYQRLDACERSCWITLLCLASMNDGIVKHCEEQYLIAHSGIDPASADFSKSHGILVKLEMLGMIKMGRDNDGVSFIVIPNWGKRQHAGPMTGYERLKKWRETKKIAQNDNDDNTRDNGKRREDKRREEGILLSAKEVEMQFDKGRRILAGEK